MVEITTLEVTAMVLTPSQKTRLGIMALIILPATPTIIIPTDLAARQKKEDNTFLAMGAVQMDNTPGNMWLYSDTAIRISSGI